MFDIVNVRGLCGVTEWRLPNLQELISLVHYGKKEPAINQAYFPQTQSRGYWTSTPNMSIVDDRNWVSAVNFSHGNLGPSRPDSANHVRLVTTYKAAGE